MSETKEILDKLNEEQLAPVLQTEGPVLVLAGAGSGKTRVLVSRIAYLVDEKGVNPAGILAITFTNKAAGEMKERLFGVVPTRDMWVSTIHSMCVRILRDFAKEAGLEKNFSIYSETERNNVLKKSFQECGFEDENLLKSAKYHVGNAKMLGYSPERYAEEFAGERDIEDVTKIYARYQKHLRENNALDFDDLLSETRDLLAKNKEVLEYLSGRFRYILVDEFQDTNAVQYEIIKMLATVHGNLFVVGDDDQSIYGWRGAKIENILHFEKDFRDAKVFKLQRNYRSTKQILNLANTVIKNNGRRKEKTLWTENEEGTKPRLHEADEESGEARYVAQTIVSLRRQGYQYKDFAVLMRLNALTRSFEQEFSADGIPFKVFGGFKFYERKEIKDLLAYLRLIANPFDSEAAVRIINFPKRGIGAKTVEALIHYANETNSSVYDALFELDEIGFTGATRQKLENFATLVNKWIKDSISLSVDELVKNIVADTNMRLVYGDDSDDSLNKLANIDEFINAVDEFCRLNPQATLVDYLAQVTLSTDTDEMDESDYVTLATIHAVKGLEFPCVFIVGLEENIMPVSRASSSDTDLEEERRLMYVAITRAKEYLCLTRSKSRFLYGKRELTGRSRFIKELASALDMPKEKPRYGGGYNSGYGGYGNSGRYRDSSGDDDFYSESNYGAARFGGGSGGYGGYNKSSYGGYNGGYNKSYGGYDRRYDEESYNRYSPANPSVYGGKKDSGVAYGGSTSFKPKAEKSVDVSVFKVGVRVSHAKFGDGMIVGVHGAGNNTIVDVAFTGYGIKQLSATIAPLKIIG
ncbi:MAG: UvrD-helicase domain-containing protein [Clostridia bacterium]|nr:UvrD-helicase domain-containing protein [Clostridia bacterium]